MEKAASDNGKRVQRRPCKDIQTRATYPSHRALTSARRDALCLNTVGISDNDYFEET